MSSSERKFYNVILKIFLSLSEQLSKHFASNCQGEDLVPLLLRGGATVNSQRSEDAWTPLFLAAMLGRQETASLLLQAGADTSVLDNTGRTADMVARQFGQHSLADMILSPRNKYRPTFPAQFMEFLKASTTEESCTILWDEHLDWRDEETGATLLHIACWTGNVNLLRSFCNDIAVSSYFTLSLTVSLPRLTGQETVCSLDQGRPLPADVCHYQRPDWDC